MKHVLKGNMKIKRNAILIKEGKYKLLEHKLAKERMDDIKVL